MSTEKTKVRVTKLEPDEVIKEIQPTGDPKVDDYMCFRCGKVLASKGSLARHNRCAQLFNTVNQLYFTAIK